MIPRIANIAKVDALCEKFLKRLVSADFSGDVDTRYASRLLVATDNSVYQRMPQAVVFPRSKYDVVKIFTLANEQEFKNLVFTPRGGGTGTNGQSLNRGIIIDTSRYMKNIGPINEKERSVFVEPGVVKDELNELCSSYNLFFSPELSTSSRACIGGMISNDAAGQGSLRYGRTSEHILELEVVLVDGTLTTFKAIKGSEIGEYTKKAGLEGEIYQYCYQLLKENAQDIAQKFPRLNRFLTGYDLFHAYDLKSDTLNLARLVCGAEGTLCTIVGAKLDLTIKPKFRALCVVSYTNFDSALRHAQALIKAGAFSVETVDSKVLNLAKKDTVWHEVKDYLYIPPKENIEGINIVEFSSLDIASQEQLMQDLYTQISQESQSENNKGILGATLVKTKEGIQSVYNMRKKAVGLLGAASGRKKLVAFTEDTVVPPENLADYILEFRALLDSLHVDYGMFGHVDTGLMHVRPALDLTLDEDKEKLITISHKVVELVKKYNGQMWGEHGRGYRSIFGSDFFQDLYPLVRKIKAYFDPNNRLNPGKICVPFGNEEDKLVALDDPMRGDLDRTIDLKVRQVFNGALNCNGNGQCFNYSRSSLMCPSYRYTKSHVNSPKGYAALMREWLRLMQEKGVDMAALEQKTLAQSGLLVADITLNENGDLVYTYPKASKCPLAPLGRRLKALSLYIKNYFARLYNTIFTKDDFNVEYLGYVATCLSCKSCKTQCPANVNAAELNSRFLNFYYSRYLRPRMDFLTLNAERMLPFLAKCPHLSNKIVHSELNKLLVSKLFNMVDLPHFASRPLDYQAKCAGIELLSFKQALKKAHNLEVIIVADAFSASFETDSLVELAKVAKFMGFKVAILKPYINGKLFIIRGARGKFIYHASKQALRLSALNNKGITLVGFDPALTLCYRDEYQELIPHCPKFNVLLAEEWLKQALTQEQFKAKAIVLKEKINKIITLAKANASSHVQVKQELSDNAQDIQEIALSGEDISESAIPTCDIGRDFYLFCHCSEKALVPLSVKMWQEVLAYFGLNVIPVNVACCGMAGLFGHMVPNLAESKTVYEQNWREQLRSRDIRQCLITGFSCRSQVLRMEYMRANHPVHVLHEILSSAHESL